MLIPDSFAGARSWASGGLHGARWWFSTLPFPTVQHAVTARAQRLELVVVRVVFDSLEVVHHVCDGGYLAVPVERVAHRAVRGRVVVRGGGARVSLSICLCLCGRSCDLERVRGRRSDRATWRLWGSRVRGRLGSALALDGRWSMVDGQGWLDGWMVEDGQWLCLWMGALFVAVVALSVDGRSFICGWSAFGVDGSSVMWRMVLPCAMS